MTKGRILITGLTIQHVGRDPRYKYDHLTKMYANALRTVGYDVEHRFLTPGEDLTGFDAIMTGLGPVNGLPCRYTYTTLDAIARARRSGAALIFFNDDWQVQLVLSAVKTMVREPKRLVRPMLAGARVDFDWACDNLDHIMTAVTAIAERPWPTTIIPQYSGGDSSKFTFRGENKLPTRKLVGVDPTSYGTDYRPTWPDDSGRWGAWVMGTLSNQQKWIDSLKLTWPVGYYGGKASKSDKGALPEAELVQMYANSWGTLSAPYWHAGSGWWRLRHDHARQAGSIMVCGPDELGFMGECFQVPARQVEQMTVTQLRELANAQAETYRKQTWSAEQFETTLDETIQAEIQEMKS